MLTGPQSRTRLAFGPFEVNAPSGELFKHGTAVRLSRQPFQVLLALLAQPGDLVTREQLVAEIWSDGTFVDFEHSLNAAVNRLRQSLGDSAEKPRYIETVPGRGYRFIGSMDFRSLAPVSSTGGPVIPEGPLAKRSPNLRWPLVAALVCFAVLAAWWRFGNSQAPLSAREAHPPYQRSGALELMRRCRLTASWSRIPPTRAWTPGGISMSRRWQEASRSA